MEWALAPPGTFPSGERIVSLWVTLFFILSPLFEKEAFEVCLLNLLETLLNNHEGSDSSQSFSFSLSLSYTHTYTQSRVLLLDVVLR